MGGIAGYFNYKASKKATAATTASSLRAETLTKEMYDQTRKDYEPWRLAGGRALTELEAGYAEGPGEFVPEDQPGYKFGFEKFVKDPYLSGQSARGKRLSGETVKGLTRYASDYAETSYDNFLRRYYDRLRIPESIAGLGQVATSGTTAAGMATAASLSANYLQTGQTMANIGAGTMAAYGGIANQGAQNYMNYMQYQKMGATGTTTTPTYGGTGGSTGGYSVGYGAGNVRAR